MILITVNELIGIGKKLLTIDLLIFLSLEKYIMGI